jgi:hypothetical protein
MRLIPRHRQHKDSLPRISISEAEITADLIYPARRRPARVDVRDRARGRRR